MVELPTHPADATLSAALNLAARGHRVFPLPEGRKEPPIERFGARATTDRATIEKWWTDPFGDPDNRNVGVATGGGLLVLDFDMKPGQYGARSLFEMEMQGLPETFSVRTPSGGLHLYFHGPDVSNSVGKIAPNVDVRSAGGYVVGPGSETPLGRYAIESDIPLADAPAWLIERCGAPRERKADAAVPLVELDTPEAIARATDYLRNDAHPSFKGAGGDITAYRTAAHVKDLGISETMCLELMLDHWNERGAPQWEPERLKTKVENAYSYGHSAPGHAAVAADEEFGALPDLPPGAPEKPGRKTLPRILRRAAGASAPESSGDPLVDGLLDRGALSVLYGDSNTGKSFVALDMAFHVSTGRPWNGRATRKGAVVYVVAEGGRGVHKRTAALCRHHGAEGDDPLFDLIVQPLNLLTPGADLKPLIEAVRASAADFGTPVEMIVIDTLSRVLAGGDENSSVDMGALVKNLDRLRESTGAHVAVVHHTGKDKARGARGHSLLRAATDTELEVAGGKLRATKQRDIEGGFECAFGLHVVPVGTDRNGRPMTSCVVDWRASVSVSDPLPETGAEADARAAFEKWRDHLARSEAGDTARSTFSTGESQAFLTEPSPESGGVSEATAKRWMAHWGSLGLARKEKRGQWLILEGSKGSAKVQPCVSPPEFRA